MDNALLSRLACPSCKEKIFLIGQSKLRCRWCKKNYFIRQGIPVLVDLSHLPEHLAGQIRYFNARSGAYGTSDAIEPWQDKYIERFFESFGSCKGKFFLDNACGSGYMSLEAAKRGAMVFACDLNISGLVKLRQHAKSLGLSQKIFTICCSSEDLPIRTSCVDGLVANAILEHLTREREAVKDITRVVKRGGVIMITVPLAYHLLNPIFLLVNYVHDKQIGHLRRYTKEMLLERFTQWKLLNIYYTGHTQKVIRTLINMIIRTFNEREIEKQDERDVSNKLFASNISGIFRKK